MRIHTRRPWRTPATIGFAALIAACVSTRTTLAQDSLDDWEWEAGEGYHEQEWYDPSDWFGDGTEGVDYEYDSGWGWGDDDESDSGWGWGDDGYSDDDEGDSFDYDDAFDDDRRSGRAARDGGGDDGYRAADDYYSAYYDGYFDGYNDGYNDDDFGYEDTEVALSGGDYGSGYVDGYYDGYYDQVEDYDYDPYYYVYVESSTNRDRNSDRQRMGDRTRQRGDRHQAMRDRKGGRDVDRVAQEHRRSAKMRGTIADIRFLRGAGEDSSTPLVARIEMEDGRRGVVNLGPRMTRSDLPFSEGDRVTLSGRRTTSNDRQVLMVHSIQANGETARIASRDMVRRTSYQGRMQRDRQRSRQDDRRMQREDRRMDRDRSGSQRNDRTQGRSSDREGDTRQRVRDRGETQRGGSVLRGEIDRISTADVDSDRYRVFRVAMQDGKQALVAVSSERSEDIEDMDIESGDRVVVQGERRRVDGRQVLVAHRVSVNGERKDLRDD